MTFCEVRLSPDRKSNQKFAVRGPGCAKRPFCEGYNRKVLRIRQPMNGNTAPLAEYDEEAEEAIENESAMDS